METSRNVVKSGDVVGVKVKNINDETLGKVEEIILDKLSGHTRYVILSFGGFLGIGDKFFALPWQALTYSPEKGCFVTNLDKERLENAPGFDKDHYPDFADQTWGASIHKYYNVRPYWDQRI